MGYDPIRDLNPPNDPGPSPTTSKRSISMLLNADPTPPSRSVTRSPIQIPPSPSGRRYDPVHNPDMPSPVEMMASSSSYFPQALTSPVLRPHPHHLNGDSPSSSTSSAPRLPHLPSSSSSASSSAGLALNLRLPGPAAPRATTSSPTMSIGHLSSSASLSPHLSPSIPHSRPSSSRSMPPPPPPLPQLPSLASTHITSHHAHPPHSQHPHPSQNQLPTVQPPPPPPPRKPSIPYAPHNRITPPNSVLIPITAEELHRLAESHRNPLRKSIPAVSAQLDNNPRLGAVAAPSYSIEQQSDGGWSPSRMMEGADDAPSVQQPLGHIIPSPLRGTKRPAADDDAPDYERLAHPSQRPHMSNSPPPPRNHNHNGPRNEVVVAQHYNARPEVGKAAREHSPIIGLKSFNNWIKAVLIAKFARPTIHETNTRPEELEFVGSKKKPRITARVLDLGCGKGGDLGKWAKSNIAGYIGVDIADVSLDQARERWAGQRRKAFDAEFFAMDCYSQPLEDRLPPGALRPPFDVVSQQFCMHYAFESEEKARMMLRNTTMFLRPGGVFIGTTPNAKPLLRKLKKIPEGEELSFGNAVYTIRFESRQPPVDAHGQSTFGHKYWFYLADAVDAPEYLVRWDAFVSLAAEYGLELIYKEDFHTIYEREQEPTEFRQLLTSMKVVDSRGESALDQDQWDAANLYIGFAFKKSLPAPALNGSGASAGNGS